MAGNEWLAAGAMHYWWECLINWKYPQHQGRVCGCVDMSCMCVDRVSSFILCKQLNQLMHAVHTFFHWYSIASLSNICCKCSQNMEATNCCIYTNRVHARIIMLGNLQSVGVAQLGMYLLGDWRVLFVSINAGLLAPVMLPGCFK